MLNINNLFRFVLFVQINHQVHSQVTPPPQPTSLPGADSKVYKTIGDTQLLLHIFQPASGKMGELRPVIIFFFGGGWRTGSVNQFVPQSKYLAERGMVAIVADYRVKSRHGITPFECVSDAKSAIRWVRSHAKELNIDPRRIVAAGGSAGGHLAVCTALLKELDEKNENLKISSLPNALVLFNPVLDMTERPSNAKEWNHRAKEISPLHHVSKQTPPTLIFHGTADTLVPIQQAIRFCERMKQKGNWCEVIVYENRSHGFFNEGIGDNSDYRSTLRKTDDFLISLGYLKGNPTLK